MFDLKDGQLKGHMHMERHFSKFNDNLLQAFESEAQWSRAAFMRLDKIEATFSPIQLNSSRSGYEE